MRAARRFAEAALQARPNLTGCRVRVELFGSLGHTGRGHGTDRAVIMGLCGAQPETVMPQAVEEGVRRVEQERTLPWLGGVEVPFVPATDVVFHRRNSLPGHPNGMRFSLVSEAGEPVLTRVYYSVGGGFVVDERALGADRIVEDPTPLPYPFANGAQLLQQCKDTGFSISTLMMENEKAWRPEEEVRQGLMERWAVMQACVERGCRQEGILPGGLKVRRRAASIYRRLKADSRGDNDPLLVMDWVNLFALAVNEENAAGGRVVTAPTNGAAGVVPAVLHYYMRFCPRADEEGVMRFLLAAGAIANIFKRNASISGAEVGCQGEVGVACSMAAAGLAEVLGGSPEQVENAAEIGMEHNLGLTCDPVGGLVQVPCIERNAMGAVKAINAARLALQGDGSHKVSLDKVVETMRQTGADMKSKYKETARGGLAVNIIEC